MVNFSGDEKTLILAAKAGEVEAFNALVLTYQDMAYSVAYRILQDEDHAADAAQNAFITAFRKLDQFKGEHFKPWLMKIVTNICYDELRHRRRHPIASLDDLENDTDGLQFDTEDETPMMASVESPERAVQRSELQAGIEDCIQRLSEVYRVIVVLSDVEGHSYEETAEISGISLGTVKSRLSRARANLRDCLRKKAELLPEEYRLVDDSDHEP
jgi:RNA polymerase sigma-70 factor (ECF subfamily)